MLEKRFYVPVDVRVTPQIVENQTYTLEEIARIFPEFYSANLLDKLYIKNEDNETSKNHNRPLIKCIRRIIAYLIQFMIVVGAVMLIFHFVNVVKDYYTLYDLKSHIHVWNVNGGHYNEDYKPYYDALKALSSKNDWFAKRENISLTRIIFGMITNGLLSLAVIIPLAMSILGLFLTIFRNTFKTKA